MVNDNVVELAGLSVVSAHEIKSPEKFAKRQQVWCGEVGSEMGKRASD